MGLNESNENILTNYDQTRLFEQINFLKECFTDEIFHKLSFDDKKKTEAYYCNSIMQSNHLQVCISGIKSFKQKKLIEYIKLYSKYYDINYQDRKRNTVLHLACTKSSCTPELVMALIELNIDLNAQNVVKYTALHDIILSRNKYKEEIVNLLLNFDTDVNLLNQQYFLSDFLYDNNINILKILINKNFSFNKKYTFDNSILHTICFRHEEVCSHRGRFDKERKNIKNIFKYLMELNTDPNVLNLSNSTVLHVICSGCRGCSNGREIIKILLDYKCDPNIQDGSGKTALHCLIKNKTWKKKPIVELLNAGIDINLQDINGNSALHFCYSEKEYIEILVNAGGDLYLPNRDGKIPIDSFTPELQDYYRGRNIKECVKPRVNKDIHFNNSFQIGSSN